MMLHDLIVKRGTIVEDIRKIKNRAGPVLRPGREASIIRRLASKHHGDFPLPALVCLWREMIGGFTHMQEPFSAVVCASAGNDRVVGLARNHYGSLTPLTALSTASACVGAVAAGAAQIGILPMPAAEESEAWWTMLMAEDDMTPRVVTRLPFVSAGAGDQALVVAPWTRDTSEDEVSLIGIHLAERVSRGRTTNAAGAAGFAQAILLSSVEPQPDDYFQLIEVDGDVGDDDPRLMALAAEFGKAFVQIRIIGGYARPLTISDKT